MNSINIEMLQIVAGGLGNLLEEMIFVGGAVTELYASNPNISDIRTTVDVDCVIELSSRISHVELEKKLRAKGFENDITPDAPICRWIYRGVKVDIMPSESEILGFSNLWYSEGIREKIPQSLPNGTRIFIFSLEYYLASKFESHKNRGGNDLRQSHDFEDIIYILDNASEVEEQIQKAHNGVKVYLQEECRNLTRNSGLLEGLECALPYGSGSERSEIVEELIQRIAGID